MTEAGVTQLLSAVRAGDPAALPDGCRRGTRGDGPEQRAAGPRRRMPRVCWLQHCRGGRSSGGLAHDGVGLAVRPRVAAPHADGRLDRSRGMSHTRAIRAYVMPG
jgi:hypothetical protein